MITKKKKKKKKKKKITHLKKNHQFHLACLFLYPLKTPENLCSMMFLRGIKRSQ